MRQSLKILHYYNDYRVIMIWNSKLNRRDDIFYKVGSIDFIGVLHWKKWMSMVYGPCLKCIVWFVDTRQLPLPAVVLQSCITIHISIIWENITITINSDTDDILSILLTAAHTTLRLVSISTLNLINQNFKYCIC